jgi:steroid delta-isomerase-like uncharacterized protein
MKSSIAKMVSLAATLALAAFVSCPASAADFYQEWNAAWNAHDVDKLVSMMAPDGTFEDVPFQKIDHGPAEFRDHLQDIFKSFPDFKCVYTNIYLRGDTGFEEWTVSATDPKTNKPFEVRGIQIDILSKGKVKTHRNYFDFATYMRQVGLLPQTEQNASSNH